MLRWWKSLVGAERGLTLLELTVVAAILSILAGLTAAAVTGSTTQSKETARVNDENELTRAMQQYSGEQTWGQFPTLDGCLPGETKEAPPRHLCIKAAPAPDYATGMANKASWKAILWDKSFQGSLAGDVDVFSPNFIRPPKYAWQQCDASYWPSTSPNAAPPEIIRNIVRVIDPDKIVAAGLRAPDDSKEPAWVVDKTGQAHFACTEFVY